MVELAKGLLLPPGLNLILLVIGFLLLFVARRTGRWLVFIGMLSLYLMSIAPVAGFLISTLEDIPALTDPVNVNGEQAIIVLGGGRYHDAPEYGNRDTVGGNTLMRLRYARRLQMQTRLPILASGGTPHREPIPEAVLMQETMEEAFGGPTEWMEGSSDNTFENAVCSKFMLDADGIRHIFLVTHAVHMPRALYAFRKTGLQVTPAPTDYLQDTFKYHDGIETVLPSHEALQLTRTAMYEWLGLIYYKMFYGGKESAGEVRVDC